MHAFAACTRARNAARGANSAVPSGCGGASARAAFCEPTHPVKGCARLARLALSARRSHQSDNQFWDSFQRPVPGPRGARNAYLGAIRDRPLCGDTCRGGFLPDRRLVLRSQEHRDGVEGSHLGVDGSEAGIFRSPNLPRPSRLRRSRWAPLYTGRLSDRPVFAGRTPASSPVAD